MKKAIFFCVLMGFGLFGCINDNPSDEHTDAKGMARIKLPQLPKGYAQTRPESGYSLTVTVTGPGMRPLSRAWALSEFGGQTVSFEDIPAGPDRVFTGILMRGMEKTHEGKYAVDIGGGENVFVPLVLRDVGTGRAEICVEIEGWSGSPDCMPIDTLAEDTLALKGCWRIEADVGGVPLSGNLTFHSMAWDEAGEFRTDEGDFLMAKAAFVSGAWRITLQPMALRPVEPTMILINEDGRPTPNIEKPFVVAPDTGRSLAYWFRIDQFTFGPADEPNGLFRGVMMDSSFHKAMGKVTGTHSFCINIMKPPPLIIQPFDARPGDIDIDSPVLADTTESILPGPTAKFE